MATPLLTAALADLRQVVFEGHAPLIGVLGRVLLNVIDDQGVGVRPADQPCRAEGAFDFVLRGTHCSAPFIEVCQ